MIYFFKIQKIEKLLYLKYDFLIKKFKLKINSYKIGYL